MDLVDWIDPGLPGVDLKVAEHVGTDGSPRGRSVMVRSSSPLQDGAHAALVAAGFKEAEGRTRYVRPGGSFRLAEIRAAFPRAAVVKMRADATRLRLAEAPSAPSRPAPLPPVAAPVLAAPRPGPLLRPPPALRRPAAAPVPVRSPVSPAEPPQAPPSSPRPEAAAQPAPKPLRPPLPKPTPSAPAVGDGGSGPTREADPAPPSPPPAPAKPALRPPVRRPADPSPSEAQPVRARPAALRVNRYQAKYVPGSKVGTPVATIPTNLAAPTRAALDRLEAECGPIDAFVAKRLGWTVDEMATFLSPEQVDAVGLALHSADKGQGFVLADQTGLGKGRVVAALARAVVLTGRTAVVITEKANLFSDLFRDIIDIGSLDTFGRPFLLNDGAEIIDGSSPERKVIHPALKKQDVADHVRKGTLPKGTKLVLATYSQFNRKGGAKNGFLKAIAEGNHLICDESHNAVGDSNTSEVLKAAMDGAAAVTYSSATFARNAKNLAAYERLFPPSMRSSDLMAVLATGGQAISEALSQMLAEDGSYLRREHDLSDIRIEVIEDTLRIESNRAYSDRLSPILGRVAKLARAVSQIVDEKNGPEVADGVTVRRKGKELWTTGNFGSRLSAIVRQFVTALLVDLCVEECVEALEAGEKPVVVIESTMESLMRELSSDSSPVGDDPIAEDAAGEETDADAEAALSGRAPDFRDALRLLVDRTMQLTVRRPGADPEKLPVEDAFLQAEAADIRRMIEDFPDLPLSPIDDVRARIELAGQMAVDDGRVAKGWKAEEISARGTRVVDGAYVSVPPQDRVGLVAGFNAGLSDALVITRAASTGLSLHASEKFADRRKRRMIELQIPSNVVERVQFWGRVNRRGQVNTPTFRTLSTGLPLQTRQLAMQNRKVADLSANVTASAESATSMDVPDIIDALGNAVCKRMLEERPALADRMHVPMKLPDPEKAEGELYHVNKFLQRLVLVPADEQDELYAEVLAAYGEAVKDLAARGLNPRGSRELEGEWKVVGSAVFEPGDPRDGPVFGRPVLATTIETVRDLKPLTSGDVKDLVARATARLAAAPEADGKDLFAGHVKAVLADRNRIFQAALSRRHLNVKQALSDPKPNAVKDAEQRLALLTQLLKVLRPGCEITAPGDDGPETGVVVDVRAPKDPEQFHLPGRWSVRYACPGDEKPREITAAAISRDSAVTLTPSSAMRPWLAGRFDTAPKGPTSVRRKVLDGNLVRAVVAARNQGWGSAVSFTDGAGQPRRAILVPKNKQDQLGMLPGRTTSGAAAAAVLAAGGEIWTNKDDPGTGASIRPERGGVEVVVPARKTLLTAFEKPAIKAVVGEYRGAGQRDRFAHVASSRVRELVDAFVASGHAFHFDGRYRETAAKALAEESASDDHDEDKLLSP